MYAQYGDIDLYGLHHPTTDLLGIDTGVELYATEMLNQTITVHAESIFRQVNMTARGGIYVYDDVRTTAGLLQLIFNDGILYMDGITISAQYGDLILISNNFCVFTIFLIFVLVYTKKYYFLEKKW